MRAKTMRCVRAILSLVVLVTLTLVAGANPQTSVFPASSPCHIKFAGVELCSQPEATRSTFPLYILRPSFVR